ncbi:MAG: UDP-N-acetylmuramoyl-tripeptide--D-alanyl-D-alanine ligase [Spirochaetia bacterium]|jgi:UDP-N-acetylmuramoyl-tripeptide--D-alanyl-D-alanine ligase|nr:UDP-N-acetylmuramoyl-tripeptide--D-alanyl-D-alanine ligase [Spirochaetia bacterium]
MTEGAVTLFSAGEAAGIIGAACRGNLEAGIGSVTVDSRKAVPDSLFVALPGERVDGHDYIEAALAGGAKTILAAEAQKEKALRAFSSSAIFAAGACLILADSPLRGLQALAREHRRRLKNLLRIGVTGSSGKTTTKECIAAALRPSYPSGALAMNEGNLNSDIGLSLSMFGLGKNHAVGVFEMGMNRRGEMEELAAIYEPDMVVVTNIGTAHIGIIGSREGIAAEKKKAFSRFDGPQTAFVWDEDPFKDFLALSVPGRFVQFGLRSGNGLERAEALGLRGWDIVWKGQRFIFPLPGRHNLLNGLAALAVASELGLDPSLTAQGLSSVRPLFGRSELLTGRIELLKDCYNANPDSMAAAIELCDSAQPRARRVYVLGSMLELGDESQAAHQALGRRAAESKADALFFFGEEAEASYLAAKALRPGAGKKLFHTDSMEELYRQVHAYLQDGDLLLLKASRGLALELLAYRLVEAGFAEETHHAS